MSLLKLCFFSLILEFSLIYVVLYSHKYLSFLSKKYDLYNLTKYCQVEFQHNLRPFTKIVYIYLNVFTKTKRGNILTVGFIKLHNIKVCLYTKWSKINKLLETFAELNYVFFQRGSNSFLWRKWDFSTLN